MTRILACLLLCVLCPTATAHFVWLVTDSKGRVHLTISETPGPSEPGLLDSLSSAELLELFTDGTLVPHSPSRAEQSWSGHVPERPGDSALLARLDHSVVARDGPSFLLRYFAKTYREAGDEVACATRHQLDLEPVLEVGAVTLRVRFGGIPVTGSTVVFGGPEGDTREAQTDALGRVRFCTSQPGTYWARTRHVESTQGELDGRTYSEVRNHSTLTLELGLRTPAASFPPLPYGLTSFGAAIVNGRLYVYGGHRGRPHQYSRVDQSQEFLRLELARPEAWESLPGGPRLQGLALVGHLGKLYRIGGFTAMNGAGEPADLHSQDGFARFDPRTRQWSELPAMPTARSSFDAVVIGDELYVVGGWQLHRGNENWHDTALVADLAQPIPSWSALPAPPFRRRALAAGEHQGKLYVIGGMREEGGPTTEVAIYDPRTRTWSNGPELLDSGRLAGFGASAVLLGERLHVTAYDGGLQRLDLDGRSWQRCGGLPRGRFFHRMLTLDSARLLVVGGANMASGSYRDLVVLPAFSEPHR